MNNFTLLPSKDLSTAQYVIKVVKIKQSNDIFNKRFHIPSGSKSVAHETFSKNDGSCNQMLFLSAEVHCIHIGYIKYQFSHFCIQDFLQILSPTL